MSILIPNTHTNTGAYAALVSKQLSRQAKMVEQVISGACLLTYSI